MAAASLPVLGATMLPVALPDIAADLGASAAAVAWVVTTFFGVQLLAQPIAGALADRLGHGHALRGGLTVLAVGALAAGVAPSLGGLLWARAVQAIGVAVVLPVVHAQLATVPSRAGRRFGLLTALGNVIAGIGPVAGTVLVGRLGWRGVFAVLAFLTVLAVALLALTCGRSGLDDVPIRPAGRGRVGPVLMADRRVVVASALGAMDNMALAVLLVGLPLVLARTGTHLAATAVAALMVSGAVAAVLGGHMADRWGHLVVGRGGFLTVAGGVLSVPVGELVLGPTGVVLGLVVAGAGLGIEFPAVQAAPLALVDARHRATAAGVAACSRLVGSLGGALLVSGLLLIGPEAVVPAAAVPALLGACLASPARGRPPVAASRAGGPGGYGDSRCERPRSAKADRSAVRSSSDSCR
jgi:MFS family permease